MYIFDTNAFYVLGNYYPPRFPSIWEHLSLLVSEEKLWSVKEVRREIEGNCPFEHITDWVKAHSHLFRKPDSPELKIVSQIFLEKNFMGLVRRSHILKGLPVADPFIVAAAKVYNCLVVTQESFKKGGARIPTVCEKFEVEYINIEGFLELEDIEL